MATKEYFDPILNPKDYKIGNHVLTTRRCNGLLVNGVIKMISPHWVQILIDNFNELEFFRKDELAGRYIYLPVTNATKQ